MIAFIKGNLEEISADNAVIDVNGFGVNVKISESTAASLGRRGSQVKLYTYTHVREDAFLLYGFLNKDDLEMFKLLLSVSGVGPKGAQGILSIISAIDLRFAIAAGDSKMISKAPGVGKKTADRIVIDLRDKITTDISDISGSSGIVSPRSADSSSAEGIIRSEAIEALVSLGYSGQEAMKAVSKVNPEEAGDSGSLLKAALKYI